MNKEGKAICIQDYSSKMWFLFKESEAGEYKLLLYGKGYIICCRI